MKYTDQSKYLSSVLFEDTSALKNGHVVFEKPGTGYLLLDGHLRLEIIKTMSWSEVRCIIARDDEAYGSWRAGCTPTMR